MHYYFMVEYTACILSKSLRTIFDSTNHLARDPLKNLMTWDGRKASKLVKYDFNYGNCETDIQNKMGFQHLLL